MPFQVFRRHQRKLLAMLAIMAMFAFVVADSLPRLFNNYATPAGVDRVVVELDGEDVHQGDLEGLRLQRGRSNYVLSQLFLRIGRQPLAPYFDQQTFGPTDEAAMVDALILERKADELGLPRSAELARAWIFEQARMRHELFRNLQPTLPAFEPVDLAEQLQVVFNQAFGRELTEAAFLADVAGQVRILQALELLSQPTVTPLDTFQIYSDRQVEVEGRYVAFPVSNYLDDVPEPEEADLRAFFEEHSDRVPDPSTGTIGFRAPRRAKVEYLALGLNAIDRIRELVRSETDSSEITGIAGFGDVVREAYAEELLRREGATVAEAIPVNPFTDPEGEEGIELSYPADFERRYVQQQLDELVQERTRQRIEDLFDPVRQAMNDFSYSIEDLDEVQTGLEAEVVREELPDLDAEFGSGEAGRRLIEVLGGLESARRDEGISFVRIGLTPTLAEPGTFEELVGPEGMPPVWRDYLAIARLDWADAPYALLRSIERITGAIEGVERPDPINPTDNETFADVLFDEDAPLFEPREFTDPEGRRYLAWKTIDLPERTRSFGDTPEEVIASTWRRDRARELAREAAESLAGKVRETINTEVSPSTALDEIAVQEGLTARSTGPRRRSELPSSFAPIDAGADLQDSFFQLSDRGEDAAVVAPDQGKQAYYVFTQARRSTGLQGTALDYANDESIGRFFSDALTSLQFFRTDADEEATIDRAGAVMAYLRREAGMEPDWTPPVPE
ncbi:hypothetical protein [Tautonia plasticadhaerens]|uniref:Periplasmic folding chaperone n=1 Tax=Tautonia plasticadhaerens TaxID=2527974 RepID=A0A518H8Y4_9BACT|nr:hypothetical protein [Tautonia plasticadhaerens]QDV37299.1 hypothetical protein ElP_52340 [Tautonia plasticadhaerens]